MASDGSNQYVDANGNRKPNAPIGSQNQFTTGKRTKHDDATRDKMRAEKAAAKVEAILDDPESTRADIIAASKILMPFGKSTYASIENKAVNELDTASEEELKEMVRALILSHPELLREFAPGVRDASQQNDPNAVQHSQSEGDKAA